MNYLKYLTLSEQDTKIGLYVLHTGHNLIHPDEVYPFPEHPSHYQFQWENGRILDEFQINYIINGQGIFESNSAGTINVESGSIIFLFPGEWHRYKPDIRTGWNEYWVGYKGPFAEHLLKNGIITKQNPVLYTGHHEKLFKLYQEVIETTKAEQPGYQVIIAGMIIQIIGMALSVVKEKKFEGKNIESIIKKAKLMLIDDLNTPASPLEVAEKMGVGYSWFRKMFKKYTGIAPGQYQMQQRIFKAREMLLNQHEQIKEIAFDLGFESNFHFTKIFKEKTGESPGKYRKKALGK